MQVTVIKHQQQLSKTPAGTPSTARHRLMHAYGTRHELVPLTCVHYVVWALMTVKRPDKFGAPFDQH